MVAPALIIASHNIRGTPESWRELDPSSAALLVEFGGADDAELDAAEARAAEVLAARSLIREPVFDREPERIEVALDGSRGHARAGRPDAGARDGADRRGRLRTARADGRDGQGPAGAAHRARLPPRGRRPRFGREPALHAHPGLRQARGPGALRLVHGGADRAGHRPLRRLAQGRARDRRQHGAIRRARVGNPGDRAHAPGQATRRSRRRACPGGRAQRRPRRPPAQPEDDPGDRGRGHHLRRMRLLRAGLPEPPPDHDPAAADRPAPRDGPPAPGVAGARGASARVRVRRGRDLRRRRHLRARLPARDRHRQAGQVAARAPALGARRAGGAAARRALGLGRALGACRGSGPVRAVGRSAPPSAGPAARPARR